MVVGQHLKAMESQLMASDDHILYVVVRIWSLMFGFLVVDLHLFFEFSYVTLTMYYVFFSIIFLDNGTKFQPLPSRDGT